MASERVLGPGDDLEMLRSPELWPAYPVLPVKRYGRGAMGDMPECGVVWAGHEVVFVVNLYMLPKGTTYRKLVADESIKAYPYKTWEGLLMAGWVVD